MSTLRVPLPPATPAARAAALVHAPLTALADVLPALLDAAGPAAPPLRPASADLLPSTREWLARVERPSPAPDSPEFLKQVDADLTPRTYLVGPTLTVADLAVFAALHPYMAQASHSALLSHPALTRHFDHLQHHPLVAPALARSRVLEPTLVPIDIANVPLVEIKPDVKAKKPAAQPQPAAETKTAAAPVDKLVKDKKKGEQRTGAAPDAAAAPRDAGKKAENKKEKPAKEKKPAAPAPVAEAPAPWMIDLRVGKIVEVSVHPDADSLYVEKIDVGEPEPRTILSGLVKYKTLEQMQGAMVITVCNLKPVSMRGIKSFGMLLCATSPEGKDAGVEFVDPPTGSQPGDRVFFEGFAERTPLELLNPKKKIFETVQPGFTTLGNREAAWVGGAGEGAEKTTHRIVTERGVCSAPTYVGASLS